MRPSEMRCILIASEEGSAWSMLVHLRVHLPADNPTYEDMKPISDTLKFILSRYAASRSRTKGASPADLPVRKMNKRVLRPQSSVEAPKLVQKKKFYSSPTYRMDPLMQYHPSLIEAYELRLPSDGQIDLPDLFQGMTPSMIRLGRFINDVDYPWRSHNTELFLQSLRGPSQSNKINFESPRYKDRLDSESQSFKRTLQSGPMRAYTSSCVDLMPYFANAKGQAQMINWLRRQERVYLIVAYLTYTDAVMDQTRWSNSPEVRKTLSTPILRPSYIFPYYVKLKGERVSAICVRKVTIGWDEVLEYGSSEWVICWGLVGVYKDRALQDGKVFSGGVAPLSILSRLNPRSVLGTGTYPTVSNTEGKPSVYRKTVNVYVHPIERGSWIRSASKAHHDRLMKELQRLQTMQRQEESRYSMRPKIAYTTILTDHRFGVCYAFEPI